MPSPVLHVLAPDPNEVQDARWLHGVLGKGAFVYPASTCWRTARMLFDEGRIVAPSGLRALIEAVHGDAAIALPEALEEDELKQIGDGAAQRGLAGHNIVDFTRGYRDGGRGDDDVDYPTRLGEEQRVLVLARQVDGTLRPWAEGDGAEAWTLSEVSARRSLLDRLPLPDQEAPEIRAVTSNWPEWKRREMRLCPVGSDGQICDGVRYWCDVGLIYQ